MTATPAPSTLDPALQEIDRRWKEAGVPDLYAGRNGPVSRERANNIRAFLYPKPKLDAGRINPSSIDGPNGEIPIRIVWPREGAPIGTLVYFHGGGFVLGDLDSHEMHAVRLANRSQVVVVNVDYRLAPECPFPQGVEDGLAATRWAHANRAKLGGAANPLAVGGDSAGGNLAAVSAIYARDNGIPLAAQLLIYPVTNMSKRGHPDIDDVYFTGDQTAQKRDFRASPALAPNLSDVAPAILGVGVHDFLYQDNVAYAALLREAGVPLVMREYPTLNHGFFSYTGVSEASAAAANELCADLRKLITTLGCG
jgi:acetyl esterase